MNIRRARDWINCLDFHRPVANKSTKPPTAKVVFDLARLDDTGSMTSRPLNAYALGKLNERKPERLRLYDNGTRTAWCIVSDGNVVKWHGVKGVSKEEALAIWARCSQITEWSEKSYSDAVHDVFKPGVLGAPP